MVDWIIVWVEQEDIERLKKLSWITKKLNNFLSNIEESRKLKHKFCHIFIHFLNIFEMIKQKDYDKSQICLLNKYNHWIFLEYFEIYKGFVKELNR